MLPRGVLAAGDANERDRAFRGEIKAGPIIEGDGLIGPSLDSDVPVKVRYHGLSES